MDCERLDFRDFINEIARLPNSMFVAEPAIVFRVYSAKTSTCNAYVHINYAQNLVQRPYALRYSQLLSQAPSNIF